MVKGSPIPAWIRDMKERNEANIKLFLVANKVDLKKQRLVSVQQSQAAAKKHGIKLFECSGKTGFNVEYLFHSIAAYSSLNIGQF